MAGPVPLWKLPPAKRKAEKARRRAERETTIKDSTDMSKDNTEVIHGVAMSKFDRIVRGLQSTAQRAADATTENASEWKGAKEQGVNNKALKLCLSLDRMAEDKRADFLKAFDAYRFQYFKGWDAQPDMFEQPAVAPAVAVEATDDEAEPLPLFDTAAEAEGDDATGTVRGEAEEQLDGPGADWEASPEANASDAEFDMVGAWMSEGEAAGLAGVGAEANPYEDGTLAAATWEKARAGAAEPEAISPYKAGWAAHRIGAALDDGNPYPEGSAENADWAKGWLERDRKESRKAKRGAEMEAKAEENGDGAEILPFVPGAAAGGEGALAATA